ncbi:MAG: xanthine dehydrogenase family protein [Candidatus Cloacimonetes bacterium]|nr:xanthine dehydrogenase family protein [Candidatus Cloacimonadota bacterium]
MYNEIKKSQNRLDGYEKVTGQAKFGADLNFGHQLYAKTVYSEYPRAEIVSIDISEAEKLEGVVDIITYEDIPGENEMFGRFPVLAAKEVKYIGDGVAVVAAKSKETAEKAVDLINVEYKEKQPLFNMKKAYNSKDDLVHTDKEDNIIEHSHHLMRKGNIKEGLQKADVILERTYYTPFVDQAYIEPEVIVTIPDPYREGIEIHGSIQNPYSIRENVAKIMDLKISQVKVIHSTIGGSFGGKDESVMLMAARTAILAKRTDRPIKMVLTREESMLESCKRHAYELNYKIGAKQDGTIVAIEDEVYTQGGPYNNKAMFANWRGSVHATGPYRVENVKTDYYGVYTNTIYGGAYRGFSAPQTVFGSESLIDELAYELDISPKEIRLKNCLKEGDTFATGQKFGPGEIPAPLADIIEGVCEHSDYEEKRAEYKEFNNKHNEKKKGIGISCTIRGAGLGGEGIDTAGATLTIDQDGSINLISDLTEMGQGMRTAHSQIAAETLGVSLERFTFINTDTSIIMDGGPTVASRGTLAGGQAVIEAARKLKERLKKVASKKLDCKKEDIVIGNDLIYHKQNKEKTIAFEDLIEVCLNDLGISLSAQGWYNPGPEELDEETGQGKAYPTYVYGCAVTEITVDIKTGKVNVDKITAGYDIGTPINPQQVKGQLYGGLLQGLGYSLMEEFEQKEGYLKTDNFDDYLIPSIKDMPDIDIKLFDIEDDFGPYGAKSVGELGIELVAPSVTNAFYDATGRRIREIPLNLERTLLGKSLSK